MVSKVPCDDIFSISRGGPVIRIKRLPPTTKQLVDDGSLGYVRVEDATGLAQGAQVTLSAGVLSASGLKIVEFKGVAGQPNVEIRIVDPVTGSDFDASAYTTALQSELFVPEQTLWYGLGDEVYSDDDVAAVFRAILPAGPGVASNVAITNFPPQQHVIVDAGGSSVATPSTVMVSTSAVTLLPTNLQRRGASIYNDSTGTLYIQVGGEAPGPLSFAAKLFQDDYFTSEFDYTGIIRGIWSGGEGEAKIVEYNRP